MNRHWSHDPREYRRATIRKASGFVSVACVLGTTAALWLGLLGLWAWLA